jgi:hypothetical protein
LSDEEIAAAREIELGTVRTGRLKGLAFLKTCLGADAA